MDLSINNESISNYSEEYMQEYTAEIKVKHAYSK